MNTEPSYAVWRTRLKAYRKQAGLSRGELATKLSLWTSHFSLEPLNLSENTLQKYESYDDQVPRARERHLDLVDGLVPLLAAKERWPTPKEMSHWMALARMGYLSDYEIGVIWSTAEPAAHGAEDASANSPAPPAACVVLTFRNHDDPESLLPPLLDLLKQVAALARANLEIRVTSGAGPSREEEPADG
jgi:hypothetical protein